MVAQEGFDRTTRTPSEDGPDIFAIFIIITYLYIVLFVIQHIKVKGGSGSPLRVVATWNSMVNSASLVTMTTTVTVMSLAGLLYLI